MNIVKITKGINIQVFSDLHIDLWDKIPRIHVLSKYLFLVGNICNINHRLFYKFFDFCSANWIKIFYTPGNTEFYNTRKNFQELQFEYRHKLTGRYKNVFYLDNECIPLEGEIDVYGSVFWAYPNFTSTAEANIYIPDYNSIRYFNHERNKIVKWDISHVKKISKESYFLLQNHLAKTTRTTIVMTHFPPIRSETFVKKHNRYPGEEVIISNSSWKDETISNFNVKHVPFWISGHTHFSYNIEKNGCNFISNQLGYKCELGTTNLDENAAFTFYQ